MIRSAKTVARDLIPPRLQVPIKYWYGRLRGHIEPEMALLPWIVGPGSHVVDVGGNRGIYAHNLHRLGATVEVFEPNPACARLLDGWAGGKPHIAVHPVALSAGQGTALLHVPVDARGVEHDSSASVEAASDGAHRDIEVALRPLDSFKFLDLDFIKIDVEGHEASVIAGAAKSIAASRPAILVEIEQRHHPDRTIGSIFDALTSDNFRGFFLRGGRLEPLELFSAERDQSLAAFERGAGTYINNFLFLCGARLDAGYYRRLTARWMTA